MPPMAAPELKMPCAKARSLIGNHTALALVAPGQFPASDTPKRPRNSEKVNNELADGVQYGRQRPNTNGEDETEPYTDPVHDLAEQGLTERIGEGEHVDNDGVFGLGQAQIGRDLRPQNGERASIDVVDHRRDSDKTNDNPP